MSPSLPARRGVPDDAAAVVSPDWVTVRNPRSGHTVRVPRSALPQMPKWHEMEPGKSRKKTDDAVSAAEPEES